MRVEEDWIYYTPQEAAELLVVKRADDEFDLDMDGCWECFGTDADREEHMMYEVELTNDALPLDAECIRRRIPKTVEQEHFI